MTTTEETSAAGLTARHDRACQAALGWAERATAEYGKAIRHEDDARARQVSDSAWQRDRMADDRRLAQFHGVRSTEALRLAEMWARVARVLTPPLEPVWSTLESTDAQDHH
ncbi:hypothetical protein [Streptomyces sp. NPDC005423]|uniref:hypothetical protein n=1 Tax=Streptomyces sp. NPDC005423 TaxID=3155343 RepID=UPI0033AF9707